MVNKSSSIANGGVKNLFTVHSEVFNLVQGNGLVLRDRLIWRRISLWISAKSPNLNFSSRNSPCWINNNSQKWLLILLVEHLCWNINTGEPAAITRMRVIPANHIFQPSSLWHQVSQGNSQHSAVMDQWWHQTTSYNDNLKSREGQLECWLAHKAVELRSQKKKTQPKDRKFQGLASRKWG